MADIAIFRINYKSDFILTLNSDAGWLTPFCIKFWTGAPSQAYYAYYDGMSYTHCAPVDGEPTKLLVQFDDHHLPIGDLNFQIGYHFTVADFPTSIEDEVINQASVIIEVDNAPAQVMLDFNGETAPEIEFSLPAYANEAQRIANEQARIAAEQQRISNEEARITAEQERQQNEQQRISQETARVREFARMKTESEAATDAANIAAALANEKAQLAEDKAALAQAAADLANAKAQLAADKAALAQAAATLANEKAALAQQKAEYAQEQGDAAKTEAETAHALNEEVRDDEEARDQAEQIRQQQETARQTAETQRVSDFNTQMQQQQTAYTDAEAARETAFNEAETERDAKVDEKVADITTLQAQIGYFVCDTAAATAAKTIVATGYVLTTGGNIRIKMTNANTADAVTLNINSTGAKALFYNGAQASSTNSWEAGEVLEVYYDGTQFMVDSIRGNMPAENVYINDTPLVSFFYAYQNYNVEDILTASAKYVYGNVGGIILEGNYVNLQCGRVPITYGDVFSLTAFGFQLGKGFFITDSDLKILEVSDVNVSVVNYKVTHKSAAYLYINNKITAQSSFRFSKAYISPDLDNDYSGGERRIPSAESVKKLHDALSVDTKSITVHIEQSGKAGSFYTDYYPLPYYADATSVITINNVSITSSGNTQIEFSNGDRRDIQGVLIRTGGTYSVILNKPCSVISIWSNADFSCDVNITFKLNSWIKPFPCYGLKVATLGDSITAISNCNIGQLLTNYLHAHLIDNFAVGSAYAADLDNTEIDFTYRQGVYTANNVLSNQVRRLLRWTTPEGEQITWTHPIDGTFSIDASIGTGLGHTDDIPDIIYIAIGINDASDKIDTDLEAIVTASYSDLTRLTMASAYRWAIETLQSAYPNAMILLASPLFISNQAKALGITKKGDIVKYVCASVGVNYIPSREESGYTNLIAYNNGGLHPKYDWSHNIAKFVAKNIEDKYVNSWRYGDSPSN